MTPLPYLEHDEHCEESSDSDDDDESYKFESIDDPMIVVTSSTPLSYSRSAFINANSCDSVFPTISSMHSYQTATDAYESRNLSMPILAYEPSAAAVDITEPDSANKLMSSQISFFGGPKLSGCNVSTTNHEQLSKVLESPNSMTYDEDRATYDLIKYLAQLFPNILVSK